MVDNLYYLQLMAKERQKELSHEANLIRLRKLARAGRPGLGDRLSVALGNRLIHAGETLKKRVCRKLSCRQGVYAGLPEHLKS